MGQLFRQTLFGGFKKKDVITYLETSAAQHKTELQAQESRLEQLQAKETALQRLLQEAQVESYTMRSQLTKAQEQATALQREADDAENRGAQARTRARELEEQLRQAEETARTQLCQLEEKLAMAAEDAADQALAAEARAQEFRGLEEQLAEKQREAETLRQTLEERTNDLDRCRELLEQLQNSGNPQQHACREPFGAQSMPAFRPDELRELRRELDRMRDSYDNLMLSMLGCGGHRIPVQEDPAQRSLLENINGQMDRALAYLERLVACRENPTEQQPAPRPQEAEAVKETEKKPVTLDEILRLVRGIK